MNKPFTNNNVSRLVLCFVVFFTQTLRNTPQYLTNFATYVFFLVPALLGCLAKNTCFICFSLHVFSTCSHGWAVFYGLFYFLIFCYFKVSMVDLIVMICIMLDLTKLVHFS